MKRSAALIVATGLLMVACTSRASTPTTKEAVTTTTAAVPSTVGSTTIVTPLLPTTVTTALPTTAPAPFSPLPDLVDPYGCGHGFNIGARDQTTGLIVYPTDRQKASHRQLPETSVLPDDQWIAEVWIGTDLFSFWCDDTRRSSRVVNKTWPIVSGTITMIELPDIAECGLARAQFTDFVARIADGTTIHLGSFDVQITGWGCFVG